MTKEFAYQERAIKSSTAWILFLIVGWSYGSRGEMAKQVFYYLTLGGLGLWALYVLFTLAGKTKAFNKKIALEVGFTPEEILMLGL